MEHHLPEPPLYLAKVPKLNQAIFYCYNASSQRIPVGMVSDFTFKDEDTLLFNVRYFPVTEMNWSSFAAELHFYRKGEPESFVLHGVAVLDCNNKNAVVFNIQNAVYAEMPAQISQKSLFTTLFKPYINLYRKSSELLMHPFKSKTATGVFQ